MSQSITSTPTICRTSKQRRQRPKIEKTNEEFKQHERILMNKRNQEVNNAVTKKCHVIWNQYLFHKRKPTPLQFNYVYHNVDKYLTVCDNYEASQHKDPKQKWWNNQKASEMSQGFLPSVLNSTDQMAQYLGQQICESLQVEFTNYCIFELLETAICAVFSTMRSGSNEVFLRTSFQYSKAALRKKLVSYFSDQELRPFDLKARKKKDLWSKLIRDKKDKLLLQFTEKKEMIFGVQTHIKIQRNDDYNQYNLHNNLPPSIQQETDSMSCSTSNNSSTSNINNYNNNNNGSVQRGIPPIPPINWNETNGSNMHYQPFQSVSLSAPYHRHNNNNNNNNNCYQLIPTQIIAQQAPNGYRSHRQCIDCMSYMNKMSELLSINHKLQQETVELKQLNHEYVTDRQEWRNKYQNLLLKFKDLDDNINNNNNNNDNDDNNNNNNNNYNDNSAYIQSIDHSNNTWSYN